jgi:hypothetical protein
MAIVTSRPSTRLSTHPPTASRSSLSAEMLFDAFYGAAFGGSAIALFFLIADSLAGHPLFTPSLVGTALFTDTPAAAVTEVRLDMVAYYSILHFAVFGALGGIVSQLCRWTGLAGRHPLMVAGVVFAILTGSLLVGEQILMPGVVSAMGLGLVLVGNALAGIVMAQLITWAHKPE